MKTGLLEVGSFGDTPEPVTGEALLHAFQSGTLVEDGKRL
jgi:hypothetical protein